MKITRDFRMISSLPELARVSHAEVPWSLAAAMVTEVSTVLVKRMWSHRLIGLMAAVLLASACDGRFPSVRGVGTVVPTLSPPTEISARHIPAYDTNSLEDGDSDVDSCQEWVVERELHNRWTGEYEQVLSCTEGGEIATIHVLGTRDGPSSGRYRVIYTLRTGERITWNYEYFPDADDPDAIRYLGFSSRGEEYRALRRDLDDDGGYYMLEEWTLDDGMYVVEGVYDAEDRFNGTVTFDDPSTEQSPDSHLVNLEEDDGAITQVFDGYMDGWHVEEHLYIAADGSLVYEYDSDDLSTDAEPDYSGGYRFDVSGAGVGEYLQLHDDGSVLEVEQQIEITGAYREVWRFRDALTEQPIDQEGVLRYDGAGNAVGSLTTYVVGGSAETCDLNVSAEGSTVISNCR